MSRRPLVTALVALVAASGLSACSGGLVSTDDKGGTSDRTPVTLHVWSFFTGREKGFLDANFKSFHQKYPWITVDSVGNQSDDTMVQATRGGNPPDVAVSPSSDSTPGYCETGVWQNLAPFITRDHVDINDLVGPTRTYTEGGGKRCAFPMLTDSFGLYANTTYLKAAGISHPPTTWDELFTDAKKLTVRKSDGTIVRAGFVPSFTYYENNAETWSQAWDLSWYTKQGRSALTSDPSWAAMLSWQKKLIDWYGFDNLTRFVAGVGNEFSGSNAFESGKVALNIDGEWRPAFITADKSSVQYSVSPVPNENPAHFGGGYLAGTTIGIPNGAHHPQASWLLLHYLAFDTKAVDALADGLLNIPSTTAALAAFDKKNDPHFGPLLKIASNRYSTSVPGTAAGTGPGDLIAAFIQQWEAGSTSLSKGLADTAREVNSQLDQAAQGGAP